MSVENNAAEMVPEGFQFPAGKDNVTVFANRIDENYLDTMAVPLVRGRVSGRRMLPRLRALPS